MSSALAADTPQPGHFVVTEFAGLQEPADALIAGVGRSDGRPVAIGAERSAIWSASSSAPANAAGGSGNTVDGKPCDMWIG